MATAVRTMIGNESAIPIKEETTSNTRSELR
jgi:hypothetical protein